MRWMVLAGVFVGLGFEAKMGAALLVVPALTVAWVWAAPRNRWRGLLRRRRSRWSVAGGAWPLLMALTPASVAAVDLGHVGQQHLVADHRLQRPRPARRPGRRAGRRRHGRRRRWRCSAATPGVLRLLNEALGGQAGWLLGFALVAGVALVVSSRLRRSRPRDRLGARRRRLRADRGGRVQLRLGHLPPLLRERARAVRRRAGRRRRGALHRAATCWPGSPARSRSPAA